MCIQLRSSRLTPVTVTNSKPCTAVAGDVTEINSSCMERADKNHVHLLTPWPASAVIAVATVCPVHDFSTDIDAVGVLANEVCC
jgi:hypothetical protein